MKKENLQYSGCQGFTSLRLVITSSHRRCFVKKGILAKFAGKFLSDFFKEQFLYKTPPAAASADIFIKIDLENIFFTNWMNL